jgi:hypothetical protein
MWPKEFRVFKVSPELTKLARLARNRSRHEDDLPRLDLTSASLSDPRLTFDQALAQEAIGERFLFLLGALATSCNCAPSKVMVMSDDHDLASDVRSGIAEYFGIVPEGIQFEQFVKHLAGEFYQWVKTHPKERREFGLECDAQGRILLECPDLRADLEPLVD